ncbi:MULTISPECIES: hypothetical protein [unclassified Bradyrhizobium]|uniref:hypothetical protein n=1 Tax=unclassified Bradyrhizobium TaxID=2631580 RepID=UPI0028E2ABDD|nr:MULTISPECIES: hypothetical protein [unclassified Bradyrhizobium]
MTSQSLDTNIFKTLTHIVVTAAAATGAWLAGSSNQATILLTTGLTLISAILALAFSLLYRRTVAVLGAGGAPIGSPARTSYDALRQNLTGNNTAARIYHERLTAFLDKVERFLGDTGMADRTLFPKAFGLHAPQPLWTAPAFDRCLWLALIYPFATIVLIWIISGHAGPAETALGLQSGVAGWQRVLAAPFCAITGFVVWLSYKEKDKLDIYAWGALTVVLATVVAGAGASTVVINGVCAVAIAVALSGSITLPYAGALAVAFAVAFAIIFVGAVAGTFSIVSAASAYAGTTSTAVVLTIALIVLTVATAIAVTFYFAFTAIIIALRLINRIAIAKQKEGLLLATIVMALTAFCLSAPAVLTSTSSLDPSGPLLLFLGLLTLVNAPFDWASLGMTRALLRRGLERGGWWPYLLALLDTALAAMIIMILAIAMVVAVQAFDTIRIHHGGKPILPLQSLFDGIASHPAEPEYWWLYALLISSMIPSFVNLMIGGAAFLRGVPGLRALLLRFLPNGKAVPSFDRPWIALVLTAQTFVGATLGVAAQILLLLGIVGYVMPWLGLHILGVSRGVADLNLPERLWSLVFG